MSVKKCETCSRRMQTLESGAMRCGIMLTREELFSGIGGAEQCWECGRAYCDHCYPARPRNSCVCGQGRDAVRDIGGTVYRGSLRLVKVRYLD